MANTLALGASAERLGVQVPSSAPNDPQYRHCIYSVIGLPARFLLTHHQIKPSTARPPTTEIAAMEWCATRSAAPGEPEHQREHHQRNILPVKTASRKGATRISNTPEANTKSFHGAGGGINEGMRIARNSWRSKRARMRSRRARSIRLSREKARHPRGPIRMATGRQWPNLRRPSRQ